MDEAPSHADQIHRRIAESLPDAVIRAEHARRFQAVGGWLISGRPKKLAPCPRCGQALGVREMMKHRKVCR